MYRLLSLVTICHLKKTLTKTLMYVLIYILFFQKQITFASIQWTKNVDGNDNWYMLPMDERRDLMKSHGMIGRQYAGKVKQIITGSVGFDDYEWGVTLFADDVLQFKKLVYEMRFDEVSARYADFGSFFVGNLFSESKIEQFLHV